MDSVRKYVNRKAIINKTLNSAEIAQSIQEDSQTFENYKKLEQSCNILIRKLRVDYLMSEVSWKCFRCNLTFKDENIADIHKEISKHSITKVKPITA